jgi:selenide,water dikinase
MFNQAEYPNLLVGLDQPDDAAVWRISDDRALILTVDFFTPVVDDPYDWGAIAAANALSDVYAMGGEPLLALNLAAMPADLPEQMIVAIMRGAADKVKEAGAVVAGGHTIDDDEPKFGLAVLGQIHPQQIKTKAGAQPGDTLLITKPLGNGIIVTAAKADLAAADHLATAICWMKQLNHAAAQTLKSYDVHALTDITGFSLLGHGWEVAERSQVRLQIRYYALPFLPGAEQYSEDLLFPAAAAHNQDAYSRYVSFAPGLGYEQQLLAFCPETSGGLLISLAPEQAGVFTRVYRALGHEVWEIGQALSGQPGIDVL